MGNTAQNHRVPGAKGCITGMKYPHLASALLAILLTGTSLFSWSTYASSLEDRYIHVLVPTLPDQAIGGSALLRSAFRQPDLLPALGSSELLQVESSYRAIDFFASYPTGFNVFVVAKVGATPLVLAQDLAAIGPSLRGKKVVISLTPLVFYHPEVYPEDYAGNFSRLHADELAFSPYLSFDLKQIAARRMLDYPDTLSRDPLLRFSLEQLAKDGPLSRLLYYSVLPLGQAQTLILRLQDQREVVSLIGRQPGLDPVVTRSPANPDWESLATQAEKQQAPRTTSNPYGVEDSIWFDTHKAWVDQGKAPGSGDSDYLDHMLRTQEWTDLNIMLRTLKELGAQPLILSLPAKGPLMDALGVSSAARQQFYDSLEGTVAAYGFPLVDYRQFDGDQYFLIDLFSHVSQKGWVYVDQTLDAFYHGSLH